MSNETLERLSKLHQATRGLGLVPDFEKYLQEVLALATELTGSEIAAILSYDAKAQELCFVTVPWFHQAALQGTKLPLDGSAAQRTIHEGRTLIVRDTTADKRRYQDADRLSDNKTRSLIASPLILRGQVMGVIEIVNHNVNSNYTDEDALILETLASLSAFALQADTAEKNAQNPSGDATELNRLKSDFIAITSHELRTPLGLILGHATFLRELTGPQYEEQLDAIIRNATRLKEIIESLTSVDNYETGAARVRQKTFSMARVMQDVVASFQAMAKQKNVSLRVNTGNRDYMVQADGSKISIALSNLVKNAITFTEEGGHVLVQADTDDKNVKVSVIDDGMGIPAQDLPRIFERFYQVESHLTRRHGGMGLGLSVAKVMIEMHGGRIWAESVEGKGSNFSFLLPITMEQTDTGAGVFTAE